MTNLQWADAELRNAMAIHWVREHSLVVGCALERVFTMRTVTPLHTVSWWLGLVAGMPQGGGRNPS